MTAAYIPSGNAATRHNTARATNVESEFQSVSDGLATFPDASDMKNGTTNYAVDTGTANALLVAMPTTATAYTDGMLIVVKALVSNTGSTTINVDGLGVKQIRRQTGSQIVAGDIVAGSIYEMRYNGTYFMLTGFGSTLVESVDNISSDISTVAGISANVTSVANNETNINAVVVNETNINATATNETNINSVATNATNINAVVANETNVNTVATNDANVTTVADNIDDIVAAAAALDPYASQAEAEAGTATDRLMSPLRTKEAIDANVIIPSPGTKEFVASGALPDGSTVALNTDGTVSLVDSSNHEDFIGITSEAIADTATGTVTILGGENTSQAGLTIGANYYVETDGTLTTTVTRVPAGKALSETGLLLSTPDPINQVSTVATLASDATVDFTLDPNADEHTFILQSVLNSTNRATIDMVFSIDGGSSYLTTEITNMAWMRTALSDWQDSSGGNLTPGSNQGAMNTTNGGQSIKVTLSQLSGEYGNYFWNGVFVYSAANIYPIFGGGQFQNTSAITNVRFKPSSGALTSGKIIYIKGNY